MTRAEDERMLTMLGLYRQGHSPARIGARFGMTAVAVKSRIQSVRKADINHDPDAAEWWRNLPRSKK
jgi:DNA-binding CsgD family transcriptional regulator